MVGYITGFSVLGGGNLSFIRFSSSLSSVAGEREKFRPVFSCIVVPLGGGGGGKTGCWLLVYFRATPSNSRTG